MPYRIFFAATLLAATPTIALAQDDGATEQTTTVSAGVEQLRHAIGDWDVVTDFLKPDGSIAGSVPGTYHFEWVVPDAVVSGTSILPSIGQTSGILFYVRPATGEIEMSAVGNDGTMWVMTGPIDSEIRTTPNVAIPDGSTLKLRFTRYNVTPDGFESRMELSTDNGETWMQGNHQIFVRRPV